MKPEPAGNLLLCAHASLTADGRLFLSDAGLQQPPSGLGATWFLAGVIDLPMSDYVRGGLLRVVDLHGEPVEGPVGKVAAEWEGDFEEGAILRAPIALPLPQNMTHLTADVIYYWEITFGDWAHRVPFYVSVSDEGDQEVSE